MSLLRFFFSFFPSSFVLVFLFVSQTNYDNQVDQYGKAAMMQLGKKSVGRLLQSGQMTVTVIIFSFSVKYLKNR